MKVDWRLFIGPTLPTLYLMYIHVGPTSTIPESWSSALLHKYLVNMLLEMVNVFGDSCHIRKYLPVASCPLGERIRARVGYIERR